MHERLLTESRVVVSYARLIFLPDPTGFGLFHDDVRASKSLLSPISTLACTIGILAAALAAVFLRKRAFWLTFGVAWFLTGHVLESTFLNLELVFEHRNYMPSVGLIIAAVAFAHEGLSRVGVSGTSTTAIAVALTMAVGAITASRAATWSDYGTFLRVGVRNHPESARYQGSLASYAVFEDQNYAEAIARHQLTSTLEPQETRSLIEAASLVSFAQAVIEGAIKVADDDETVATSRMIESVSALAASHDLEALKRDIVAEVDRRLKNEPVNATTGATLSAASADYIDGIIAYRRLETELLTWLQAATRNPAIVPEVQGGLELHRSLILVASGSTGEGVEAARAALELLPDSANARLALANALFSSGDSKAANDTVRDIDLSTLSASSRVRLAEIRSADGS